MKKKMLMLFALLFAPALLLADAGILIPRDKAQRFILQCVVGLFAQSIDLLPRGLLSELLDDCKKGGSTFDALGALFRQMASPNAAVPRAVTM